MKGLPSISASGSSPNSVGVHTNPFSKLPTISSMRQFSFPEPGLSRIPRPIIWLNKLRERVGRVRSTQSIAGTSAPSVRIADEMRDEIEKEKGKRKRTYQPEAYERGVRSGESTRTAVNQDRIDTCPEVF